MNPPDCHWHFDHSYARLPGPLFTALAPTPVAQPKTVVFNHRLATALGLNAPVLSKHAAALLSGNQLPEGALPLAQAYAGHQFGSFTVLGDGRAIVLGEHLTPQGERVDIQLKGSGRTPYSRRGDGRAALGPMLREYLISEALYALGIPTTRSLAVVATGEPVWREAALPGAVLTRVAASHLRVGTFEYAAAIDQPDTLRALVDYALWRHPAPTRDASPALTLLHAVCERQAVLITHWMRVGFIHGVMNTDNMSIAGETIDFGPCAFLNAYDPARVFSSIDRHGRYAFGNQPRIAQWNLARLAEALLPLIHPDPDQALTLASDVVHGFMTRYETLWLTMMGHKLGLMNVTDTDRALADDLLNWMHHTGADFTQTFRLLPAPPNESPFNQPDFTQWHQRWQARLDQQPTPREAAYALMRQHNPAYIPRNHLVEAALEAAQYDELGPFQQLLTVLADPYVSQPEWAAFEAPPPAAQDRGYRTFCGT